MCVAIVVPQGVPPPSLKTLEACETENPHGGGIAYTTAKGVQWHKGLTAKQVFHRATENAGKPMLIHFRIATAGTITPELCHPFPITKKVLTTLNGIANEVLIHNGHWWKWEDYLPKGARVKEWTDTRVMAWIAHYHGVGVLANTWQRVATLRRDGQITKLGSWLAEAGIFYSNFNWKEFSYSDYYRFMGHETGNKRADADAVVGMSKRKQRKLAKRRYWKDWEEEIAEEMTTKAVAAKAVSDAPLKTSSESAFDAYVRQRYAPESSSWESIVAYFSTKYPNDEEAQETAAQAVADLLQEDPDTPLQEDPDPRRYPMRYLWDEMEEVQLALIKEDK